MGAEAAISTVVQLLSDVLIQKVKFLRGVEDQVRWVKDELNRMKSFLRDANSKQSKNESVRTWIEDIREVALDMEDTIEMFTLNVEIAQSRCLLEGCAGLPNHLRHLDSIGEEIESIRLRLAEIDKSRERYGIVALSLGEPSSRSEVEDRRRLVTWHKDEHLVGMEDDVAKLLKHITDEENKGLSVAAIVGMGGIGKSTLAREIYNHPDVVSGRFDCRAWVVVSSEFNRQETIKQIIQELTSTENLLDKIKKLEESTRDGNYLQEKLREMLHKHLEGKTYFIVLDDVWEKDHWDYLMTALPTEQDKTSRLLFTSRQKDITNQCQILHEMKLLDTEKSWELFLKKGLIGNNCNGGYPKELEQIGRHVMKMCGGLPLSITVMGGLLAEKGLNMEWEEALKELNSLPSAEDRVSKILELSYQNLSPKLKCCFLCLAFFREDATVPVKRVLNIMVGQGLIQQTGRRTSDEDIARGYLNELINRNLVQVKDLTLDNRVKSCQLHDSLHKLCLHKAHKEIGLENLIGDRRVSLEKPRHQVVSCDDLGKYMMSRNKHIRSIFMLNVNERGFRAIKSSYWKSFQHLKTLDLEVNFPMPRLPGSFRFLLGLKQLRIHTASLQQSLEIPTWLSTFKKLELLDMVSVRVIFPTAALEMDSLRHINASYINRVKIGDRCKNLESLKYIKQGDWMKCSLRQGDDCHVRKLGIVIDDETTMQALLEKLENLVKLVLWFPGPRIDLVSVPCVGNLTKLKLIGKMRPSASMCPANLSHLTLQGSKLGSDPMQELGKLPKLSYLKLKNYAYKGERMRVLHDGFPNLKGLFLRELFALKEVVIEEGGMPQLKLLKVFRCRRLNTKDLSNKSYHLQIQGVETTAEAALSSVVKRIGDVRILKVNFHLDIDYQVMLLEDELNMMHSFLRDANKRQALEDRIGTWISDVREVALDAEDMIEMLIVILENPSWSMPLLPTCACFTIGRDFRGISEEIKSIRARLYDIDQKRKMYGIKDLESRCGSTSEVEASRRGESC